jgi:hypothetical protein
MITNNQKQISIIPFLCSIVKGKRGWWGCEDSFIDGSESQGRNSMKKENCNPNFSMCIWDVN